MTMRASLITLLLLTQSVVGAPVPIKTKGKLKHQEEVAGYYNRYIGFTDCPLYLSRDGRSYSYIDHFHDVLLGTWHWNPTTRILMIIETRNGNRYSTWEIELDENLEGEGKYDWGYIRLERSDKVLK